MGNIRGNYKTKQREVIFNFLVENKERHVTIDEIVNYIKSLNLSVGKTTVYRYIDELEEKGVVRKYIVDKSSISCYQYIDSSNQCQNHFHLKCKKCGQLYHLDCDYLHDIDNHVLKNHGFMIDDSRTVFYGTCKKCLNK